MNDYELNQKIQELAEKAAKQMVKACDDYVEQNADKRALIASWQAIIANVYALPCAEIIFNRVRTLLDSTGEIR